MQIGAEIGSGFFTTVYENIDDNTTVILCGDYREDCVKLLLYASIGALHSITVQSSTYTAVVDKMGTYKQHEHIPSINSEYRRIRNLKQTYSQYKENDDHKLMILLALGTDPSISKEYTSICQIILTYDMLSSLKYDDHLGNWFVYRDSVLPVDVLMIRSHDLLDNTYARIQEALKEYIP